MKFKDILAKEECKVIIGYYTSELNTIRDYELCRRWLLCVLERRMKMEKNKMQEQRETNYKKWFYRWIKKYDLKKQIEIANNKNYTSLNIPIHRNGNERDKVMMADDNFVNMLKREFIGFKVTREKEVKDRYFLGRKTGQVEINTVYIDWS